MPQNNKTLVCANDCLYYYLHDSSCTNYETFYLILSVTGEAFLIIVLKEVKVAGVIPVCFDGTTVPSSMYVECHKIGINNAKDIR